MLQKILALKSLVLTQPPSWIRPPKNIEGMKSSVTIAFEDPDGSCAKDILQTQLFMFGAPVIPKCWVEKPKLHQCSKCWDLGHLLAQCKAKDKCCHCSD